MSLKRIALIGTGLIGGSLGLAWKRALPDSIVTGLDAPSVLDEAAARGAIDERAASAEAAVREADLVVLATPLPPLLRLLEEIAPHLRSEAVVTDVGAVKTPILAQARSVLPDAVSFVGGHPLVTSSQRGFAAADPALFEGVPYILCSAGGASEDALRTAQGDLFDLIEAVGAVPHVMSAAAHDRALATARHLPQFLTAALAEAQAGGSPSDRTAPDAMDAFATSLFAALAHPTEPAEAWQKEAWREEVIGNQGPVLDVLGRFASALQALRNRLIEEDAEALEQIAAAPLSTPGE